MNTYGYRWIHMAIYWYRWIHMVQMYTDDTGGLMTIYWYRWIHTIQMDTDDTWGHIWLHIDTVGYIWYKWTPAIQLATYGYILIPMDTYDANECRWYRSIQVVVDWYRWRLDTNRCSWYMETHMVINWYTWIHMIQMDTDHTCRHIWLYMDTDEHSPT